MPFARWKAKNLFDSGKQRSYATIVRNTKLFHAFGQACQGSQLDEGTKLVRVTHTETDSNPQSYRIPNHADFLIAFSTVPGTIFVNEISLWTCPIKLICCRFLLLEKHYQRVMVHASCGGRIWQLCQQERSALHDDYCGPQGISLLSSSN